MKVLVSLSGGMDSATVLGLVKSQGHYIKTVGFTYGSKHNAIENEAARKIAEFYSVPFQLIDLSSIMASFKSDLLLSGGKIPEGHYEEASMKQTVVPGRNIIFSAILAGIAMSEGLEVVYLGVHAGDHAVYPDCRPKFVEAMRMAILAGTETVDLGAPFLHDTKVEILKYGYALNPPVPYHLTRTCYTDQETACGLCGACQERLSAYKTIGKEDPIPYMNRELLPKKS